MYIYQRKGATSPNSACDRLGKNMVPLADDWFYISIYVFLESLNFRSAGILRNDITVLLILHIKNKRSRECQCFTQITHLPNINGNDLNHTFFHT